MIAVTGSMLRDLVVCERRVWHDVHSGAALRDPVPSFVQLLWAGGHAHEAEVLGRLAAAGRVVDLRGLHGDDRERATREAMVGDADHVLGGRVVHGDLLGDPDLLSRVDGRWHAGDVKAGSPLMPDGRRPKLEYAVQVGLYAAILDATGLGAGSRAFVVGADGRPTWYELSEIWSRDLDSIDRVVGARIRQARAILVGSASTRPALSAACGLCHWRTLCRAELSASEDLTLVPELGRELRRKVERVAADLPALAALDVDALALTGGRTVVAGLGSERLVRLRDRARLLKTPGAQPYARVPLGLDRAPRELHLDIEADPTRDDLVYLHGVWERTLADGVEATRFHHWFADSPDGERAAWAGAWAFLSADPEARVYYYSPYEKTSYGRLARRYPDVVAADDVQAFFASARTVDLYTDVVRRHTEWPTNGYGIKPLAKFLGFSWAAEDASGANSIAWYQQYVATGDPAVRDKVVDYNRSDCIASAVLLDALIALPVCGSPDWPPPAGRDRPPPESPEPISMSPVGVGDTGELHGPAAVPEPERRGLGMAAARRSADRATGSPIYAAPMLRPCRAIAPESRDGAFTGSIADAYAALVTELPLGGGGSMRPTRDGGVELCAGLRDALPWMGGAIDVVERQLKVALWAGRPWIGWRPICLVGAPGVGKSHFAREVGRLAGVATASLDLGAMHDADALVATGRGWSTAKPCWPAQVMATSGVANPVLVLDEIEKAGGSRRNGDPKNALLAMLEPATARGYLDSCLMAEIDLSQVCWICTANDLEALSAPLLSRLEIVDVPPPGVEHLDAIISGVTALLAARWGVPPDAMPELPDRARRALRGLFAKRRSVRLLRRRLEDLLSALIAFPRDRLH